MHILKIAFLLLLLHSFKKRRFFCSETQPAIYKRGVKYDLHFHNSITNFLRFNSTEVTPWLILLGIIWDIAWEPEGFWISLQRVAFWGEEKRAATLAVPNCVGLRLLAHKRDTFLKDKQHLSLTIHAGNGTFTEIGWDSNCFMH